MRKGAKAYVTANFVAQLSALLRFTALARLLGPEELGFAAMLILTSQFFQTVSATGSDRFLVQDKDGDSPRMQGLIQAVLVGRGVLIASAMFLFADLIAAVFAAPQLREPLMALALAPLVGGFIHLDLRRVQRQSDFRPESVSILVSEILSLVGTVVAAWITRDASAVVYGLVLRSAAHVLISHLTAQRPYRFAFERHHAARFSSFAAPLFLNGLLLFFGSQGDRVLVANSLGAEALGHYSAVLLLIYYPTTMLTRMVVGFFLPPLARARDNPERYAEERNRLIGRMTLSAIGILAGFALVAPIATPLLYGPDFVEPLWMFGLIGALQTVRFLRVWPNTLANSIGRSSIILFNSIVRVVALPAAIVVGAFFRSLEAIVIVFFLGEFAALLNGIWLLHRAGALKIWQELGRAGLFLLWVVVICGWTWELNASQPAVLVALAAGTLVAVALLATERKVIADGIQQVLKRLRRLKAKRQKA